MFHLSPATRDTQVQTCVHVSPTCVGEQAVGAEADALRQVGGELLRFQSHRPEVAKRRLLKPQRDKRQTPPRRAVTEAYVGGRPITEALLLRL